MKKPLLLTAAGAALFAAGYWTRDFTSPQAPDSTRHPVTTARELAQQATSSGASGKPNTGESVRGFTPGRPFPKGGAKAWLLSLAPTFGGDRRSRALAMVETAQSIITMDAASSQELSEALLELISLEAQGDPSVKQIPDVKDMLQAAMMMNMIRLSQDNPDGVLAILKAHPNIGDGEAMLFVMGRIAATDPARAEQMALTLEGGQQREALEAIASSMSAKDPAAALTFGRKHPDAIDTHEQRRILEAWARRDPQQALPEAVKAMQATKESELLRQPLEEWFKRDPGAATAWVATQSGDPRVVADAMLLQRTAMENPEAAMQGYAALQQQTTDPKHLTRLAGSIGESLAQRDIAAAREWAGTLPPGEPQNAAFYQIAARWVDTDAPAASEWIRTLPPGNARDNAAGRLIEKIQRQDPAAALEWARSMQNESQRTQMTQRVLGTWQEQDPEAAKAAREALQLAPR